MVHDMIMFMFRFHVKVSIYIVVFLEWSVVHVLEFLGLSKRLAEKRLR